MNITYKSIITLVAVSLLFGMVAYGADNEYRFTHNDHDTLIIGEITEIDGENAVIRASDYIVSSKDLNVSAKKKQLQLETVKVDGLLEYDNMKNAEAGDYVIVSLNKSGNKYVVANGAFPVDSLDYKTLKVMAYSEATSAMLSDFVNSGGTYTEFAFSSGTVTRQYDGVDTVIYQSEQPTEQTNTSITDQVQQTESDNTKDFQGYQYYIIYGAGGILVLLAIVFVVRKNRR